MIVDYETDDNARMNHDKHLARTLVAEHKRFRADAPACALQDVGTNCQVETPEEREAFEKIERDQNINAIAAIVRKCETTSSHGIAALLVDAGYGLVKSVKRQL